MDATFEFAHNFANTAYDDLPAEVVEITKKQILDLLGIIVRGASASGVKELTELTLEWGGAEESSIIGRGVKVPAPNAAQVNASMAHSLDFDDVHESAVIHPGVTVIPTCMAIAEKTGNLSGKALITGSALGIDMICRLARATTPGESPIPYGWHLTSVYGFMVAAASAGKIFGFDEDRMVKAMGIAYQQCAGNGQAVKDGGLTKRLGPGFSVKGGVTSAMLAEKGVTGAINCLEGDWGLYNVYFKGRYDRQVLTGNLGKYFEGTLVAIKPYPCCRGVHPSIDAALALVEHPEIAVEKIQQVKVFVTNDTKQLLCMPFEAKCKPRNQVDCQFSVPWGVATALVKKRAVLEDFTPEAISDPSVLSVTDKIVIEVDDSLRSGDKSYPTRLEITTKEGAKYTKEVINPLGSIERPMSYDDVARKFASCAKSLGDDHISETVEYISKLEQKEDIRPLFDLLKH